MLYAGQYRNTRFRRVISLVLHKDIRERSLKVVNLKLQTGISSALCDFRQREVCGVEMQDYVVIPGKTNSPPTSNEQAGDWIPGLVRGIRTGNWYGIRVNENTRKCSTPIPFQTRLSDSKSRRIIVKFPSSNINC